MRTETLLRQSRDASASVRSVVLLLLFSCSVVSDSCSPMDYRPPGSSVHGISQARILEWVAISSSRDAS